MSQRGEAGGRREEGGGRREATHRALNQSTPRAAGRPAVAGDAYRLRRSVGAEGDRAERLFERLRARSENGGRVDGVRLKTP